MPTEWAKTRNPATDAESLVVADRPAFEPVGRAVRLSPSLEPLREAYQPRHYQRLDSWVAPSDPRRVAAIAIDIARPLGFARIDFLFAADGSCILNEVTLTPNNARAYLHPDLDIRLGELWKTLS